MKNINEINIDDYKAYYLSQENKPFVIKKYTESGYIDINDDDYDLIQTNSGVLVGYKKQADIESYQNHMYETQNGKKYIQLLTYDFLKDIFAKEQIGSFDFYAFFKSIPIEASRQYVGGVPMYDENGNVFNRCDIDKFGGAGFYPVENPYHIIKLRALLDIAGIGHIAYFNTTNTENQNPLSQANNVSSRTLTGIFKILLEWSNMAKDPFNSIEDPAIIASEMVQELNIPVEIIEWLDENQIDMGVYRYLKGETNINPTGIIENDDIPEIFKNFFMERCLYKNLVDIKTYHPKGSTLDDNLITKEKEFLNSIIYSLYLSGEISDLSYIEAEKYFSLQQDSIKRKSDWRILYYSYKNSGNL